MNLKQRVRRTEDCLRAVQVWINEREQALRDAGDDNRECHDYVELMRLRRRVNRTLPPNRPFNINVPNTT